MAYPHLDPFFIINVCSSYIWMNIMDHYSTCIISFDHYYIIAEEVASVASTLG